MAFFDFLWRKKAPAPAVTRSITPATAVAAAHAPLEVPFPGKVATDPIVDPAINLPSTAAFSAPDLPHPVAEATASVEEPGHAGPDRRERVRRKARAGTRVLVIDDSPTIVALLKRMLQQNGLEVLEAFDAESGIETARREVPDLIFLDIVLPGMDGFNALRTLRRDPITKHLPIIMISGNAQATEQFYVQRIGADDFMKKPFSRAEVFNRIDALLDEDGIPRHTVKPGTRAEAAEAAAHLESQAAG